MQAFTKSTDTEHCETLSSKIVTAVWIRKISCAGEPLAFEVWTQFVGNGADITLTVKNQNGKAVGKIKDKVFGNRLSGKISVPEKGIESLAFTAKLPRHGLKADSNTCRILPPIRITGQKWSQNEARRGDIVRLTADAQNVPEGTEAMIRIYEYDRDGAHDFISQFQCRVKNRKIEADWAYEFHEDTDDIPTDEEAKTANRSYNPPEYFWVIDVHGKKFGARQESGLLRFKDWIEIELKDVNGNPVTDIDYKLYLPDGSQREGHLDDNGVVKEKDIPPGPYHMEFLNYGE